MKRFVLAFYRGFTSSHLFKLIAYWLLAFKLACDEVFRKGGPHPQDVEVARRLYRELGFIEEVRKG